MMLMQCLYADGSDAGKLLVMMGRRCVDIVAMMLVRPYPVKVLQTLIQFIAEKHYEKNYNQKQGRLLLNGLYWKGGLRNWLKRKP